MNATAPKGGPQHRRAHSDTSFRFEELNDDFLIDLDNFNIGAPPSPSPSIPIPIMAVDCSKSDESSGDTTTCSKVIPPVPPHLRSLSLDNDFFEGLSFGDRRTSSMDGGPSSSLFEGESLFNDGVKKAMPPHQLAQLALIDPKRAKRILANRQSAARSKERKIRYTGELERRVQTLQTEATTLSAQVTLLQRDTTGLTIENKELKLRLQALEQQAQLRDALNDALRQEVQRLRIATGQNPTSNNNSSGRGMYPQFPAHSTNATFFGGSHNQSHLQPPHSQFQMPQQSTGNNLGAHKQLKPNFMDFNHKG